MKVIYKSLFILPFSFLYRYSHYWVSNTRLFMHRYLVGHLSPSSTSSEIGSLSHFWPCLPDNFPSVQVLSLVVLPPISFEIFNTETRSYTEFHREFLWLYDSVILCGTPWTLCWKRNAHSPSLSCSPLMTAGTKRLLGASYPDVKKQIYI